MIFFLNYCIIYSTTVFTAYPQHMHTVLFAITLPSRLTLLFTYASFSQLLHNWHYTNVCSISSTFTYNTVWNTLPSRLTLCLHMLPFHNMIFFHNYYPIDSTTMSTAYSQHIHIVLCATTLHSKLALLFIYAFLFTMWYFSSITA